MTNQSREGEVSYSFVDFPTLVAEREFSTSPGFHNRLSLFSNSFRIILPNLDPNSHRADDPTPNRPSNSETIWRRSYRNSRFDWYCEKAEAMAKTACQMGC
jgi:hypothetical protein